MNWLFVCAHPDDLEFYVGYLIITILKERKEKDTIRILSMTRGEMSSLTKTTQSTNISAKIRSKELITSCSNLGIDPANIDFLELLDGFVRLNSSTVDKIISYLQNLDEQPDCIVCPEPVYTYYQHQDHTHTGKILYFSLKKMSKQDANPPPIRLFYYGSYKNTHFFPKKKKYQSLLNKSLDSHVTQRKLLTKVKYFNIFLGILHGRKIPQNFAAEGIREQYIPYIHIKNTFPKPFFLYKVIYYIGYLLFGNINYEKLLKYIDNK